MIMHPYVVSCTVRVRRNIIVGSFLVFDLACKEGKKIASLADLKPKRRRSDPLQPRGQRASICPSDEVVATPAGKAPGSAI